MAKEWRTARELDARVWETVIGPDWTQKQLKNLDLSSDYFALESLSGVDGGLWNPLLNLKHLEELNLQKNKLNSVEGIFVSDAPFGLSLKNLLLSKNLLSNPLIDLPHLVLLDLSYNYLDAVPCLNYLPNLEILRLSHNQISSSWDEVIKCPKLVELDLSNNAISIYPSELEYGLHYLKSCPKLQKIYFKENPFSNWFPEYQLLLSSSFANLQQIDDWKLTDAMRATAPNRLQKTLEEYDEVYKQRIDLAETAQASQKAAVDHTTGSILDDVPTFEYLVSQVQNALEDPDQAVAYCSTVVHATDIVHNSELQQCGKLFGKVGLPSEKLNPHYQSLITTFLQTVTLLIERHENTRTILLRSLAKLGTIPHENLGPNCLSTLSDIMQGSEDLENLASAAVGETLTPSIQGHEPTEARCKAVLQGISSMKPRLGLARALSPVVVDLAGFYEMAPTDSVIIDILAMAVDYPANAIELAGQGIPQLVSHVTQKQSDPHYTVDEDSFLKLLHVAGCCAAHVRKAATHFVKHEVHTKLVLEKLKTLFRTPETSQWKIKQARSAAAMIDFLTGIMQTNDKGMTDCVDSFHLTDILLIPCKEHVANPHVLAAAIRGLVVILNDSKNRASLLEYITEQLSRLTPLLQYFGGLVYKSACDIAERHVLQQDTLLFRPSIPEVEFNANPFMHECFAAICLLLKFYLDHPELPYCVAINNFLSTRGREKMLFKVLLVPNNEVKLLATGCLARVPIENFDSEDVACILQLLRKFRTFSSVDAAGIIIALLDILRRFVDDANGEAGSLLRKDHPEDTISSVYDMLSRAVKCRSKTQQVETAKIQICVACVEFLCAASRYTELRNYMRSKDLNLIFRSILKAEEIGCFPDSQDVTLERCWTGRDPNLLLQCFSGVERLSCTKKVAFRVLSQIADLFQGRSAIMDVGVPIMLQGLCERETKPLNDVGIRQTLSVMDESEWLDRAQTLEIFFTSNGVDKLISFVSRVAHDDFYVRQAIERKKKEDSEYWAGRLKALKEDMEDEIQGGNSINEQAGDPQRIVFYPPPESIEDETRWVVLQAFHRSDKSLDPQISALYLRCDAGFYGSSTIWDNLTQGVMRNVYIVSSLYRALYASMLVPSSDVAVAEVIRCCKRPSTIRKLISILETVQLLECHVGAKFLAVVRSAFTLEPHQPAESMDMIISYDIVAKAIQRMMRPFLHVLKHSRAKPLGLAEQTFATETARLVAVICLQLPYIKFSVYMPVQRWCIKKALLRYVDIITIHSLVSMIIYDLAVAAGSTRGTFIEHLLPLTAQRREDMRESCLASLSALVQHCEPLKYAAIEAFNVAETFHRAEVRKTFLFELFEATNCGHYRQAILYLSVKNKRAERVLQLPVVRYWDPTLGGLQLAPAILAVTNYNYYRLAKPDGIRNFCATASHTSELNAVAPIIQMSRSYKSMTRIVRGFPTSQVLMIGWTSSEESGESGEKFEIIICDTLVAALPLLQCLHALSGPDDASRAGVYRDTVTRASLKTFVALEDLRVASYVIRNIGGGQRELRLHVLTDDRFYEFKVDWKYWFAASPKLIEPSVSLTFGEGFSDEEDVEPLRSAPSKGLDNFLGYVENETWDKKAITEQRDIAMNSEAIGVLTALDKFNKTNRAEEEAAAKDAAIRSYSERLDIAKMKLLVPIVKYKLKRLHELTFTSTEEPCITYRFATKLPADMKTEKGAKRVEHKENEEELDEEEEEEEETVKKNPLREKIFLYDTVHVIYLDDSSRERWRRYVAEGLNRLEAAGHWRRTWKDH